MPLIICEINLILTWPAHCIISSATGTTTFEIIDAKLYVPSLTLLTQDNAKLLQQLIQILKEQLIGININQKYPWEDKTNT